MRSYSGIIFTVFVLSTGTYTTLYNLVSRQRARYLIEETTSIFKRGATANKFQVNSAESVVEDDGTDFSEESATYYETDSIEKTSSDYEKDKYSKPDETSHTILYWATTQNTERREFRWFLNRHNMFTKVVKCGKNGLSCKFTNNVFQVQKCTAVMFHVSQCSHGPSFSFPHQVWVFYEGSAPPISKSEYPGNFDLIQNRFNITMTYSLDSDLPIPITPWLDCNKKLPQMKTGISSELNYAKNKTKFAAWLLFRCKKSSYREKYIEELDKHIQIDKIGQCQSTNGQYFCPGNDEECFKELLNRAYKFLFVFEQTLCQDYVSSEALKLAFTTKVVPVVLGLANYDRFLPKGSYIDVLQFSSPKELAMHLIDVSENDDLFNQYIYKKLESECTFSEADPVCTLCTFLHQNATDPGTHMVRKVQERWNRETLCYDNKEVYKKLGIE